MDRDWWSLKMQPQAYLSGTFSLCQRGGVWHFLGSFASFASMCGNKHTYPLILRVGN